LLNIKFSRHAKRRIKLYEIDYETINNIITKGIIKDLGSKRFSAILEVKKFKYPIKIVYIKEENEITIITCYPIKRSYKDES
jgi:hypothetical protein